MGVAPNVSNIPLLVAEALLDPNSTDAWVKAYVYTVKGELKVEIMPSAVNFASYAPNLGTMLWSIPTHADKGLVNGYVYNAGSRVTAAYVRAGYDAPNTGDTPKITTAVYSMGAAFARAWCGAPNTLTKLEPGAKRPILQQD